MTVFVTWKEGRALVMALREDGHEKLETFVSNMTPEWPRRVPGTSVYLTPVTTTLPTALASSLYRYQTLRRTIIVLKIAQEPVAHVKEDRRITLRSHGKGVWQVILHYGFFEEPNAAADLRERMAQFPDIDLYNLTFFVGHSIFVEGGRVMKPKWRKKLFLWLANSVEEEIDFSHIASEELIQIGTRIVV